MRIFLFFYGFLLTGAHYVILLDNALSGSSRQPLAYPEALAFDCDLPLYCGYYLTPLLLCALASGPVSLLFLLAKRWLVTSIVVYSVYIFIALWLALFGSQTYLVAAALHLIPLLILGVYVVRK